MFTANLDEASQIIRFTGDIPKSVREEIQNIKSNENNKGEENCPLLPYSCFILLCYKKKFPKNVQIDNIDLLKTYARSVGLPLVEINDTNNLIIKIPVIPSYLKLVRNLGGNHKRLNIYQFPKTRLYECARGLQRWEHEFLIPAIFTNDAKKVINLPFYRRETNAGTLRDLFNLGIEDLNTIQYGYKIKAQEGAEKLKLNNLSDLILKRPQRYVQRTNVLPWNSIPYHETSIIKGKITSISSGFDRRKIFYKLDVDGHEVSCIQFGGWEIKNRYRPNEEILFTGKRTGARSFSVHSTLSLEEAMATPIVPVYRASPSNGLKTEVLLNCIDEILTRFDGSEIFSYLDKDDDEPTFWESVEKLHFPESEPVYLSSVDRLAYIELMALQTLFIHRKESSPKLYGTQKVLKEGGMFEDALEKIPFTLTEGQRGAIDRMRSHLRTDSASEVLLSGDVGSGKSLVATLLSLYVVDNDEQVAILAPTEVLARQLYQSVKSVVSLLDKKPALAYLAGSTPNPKEVKEDLKSGFTDIIVGTHSLLNAEYANLGFVVIDEQQKFGSSQRDKLILEGRKDNKRPDVLSQTATPIPRSTAQAFYGDIDLITIQDKPPGRIPIKTEWVKSSARDLFKTLLNPVFDKIEKEIDEDHQVFIICPQVEDSGERKVMSVTEAEKFLKARMPTWRIASITGRTSKTKQESIMKQFRNNEYDILIGSTVLEVGVDIPNATVMVVLDADYFGISSLHQIRGRVGRSDVQSYCYLVSDKEDGIAGKRLEALESTDDGFKLALVDLSTRKEGDVLGVRQSGETNLRFANLIDHSDLIARAKEEANRLYFSKIKEQVISDVTLLIGGEENGNN